MSVEKILAASKVKPDEGNAVIDHTAYLIDELTNIVSITTGEDHFLALRNDGDVFAMGEDKYGQCGQFHDLRATVPPYRNVRIGKPQRVNIHERITKISAGKRHSLAISEYGRIYGWGYNHQQQLSHGQDMVNETTQKMVIFEPVSITHNIDGKKAILADGGDDFSTFVVQDSKGVQE
jgi:alpha-tubulin suppressor-like RCC1 family protein